jgi:DNA-directed RNA polymerase subunit beta'
MPSDLKTLLDFKSLQVKLASPEEVRMWSHGEVTKPETINYRTLRAEKDGLFDERIFGPTRDYECYCGKYRRIRYKGIICDKCGVEVTQSRVRRERMGHITLAAPVAHIWFFRGAPPSKLALILDITPRSLEQVIYFAQYIVTEVDESKKTRVLEVLEKVQRERIDELKHNAAEQLDQLRELAEKEKKETKERVTNKDASALALDEVGLKQRQKEQSLRDETTNDLNQTEAIFKRLSEIVKDLHPQSLLTEDEYNKLSDYSAADFFEVDMGAEAILELLKLVDLDKMSRDLREEIANSTGQRRIKATKRLRVVDGMRKAGVKPEWMVLTVLPVIPPDLRPMVQLSGGRFATSDLNDLYRRVINRNNRLKHLMELGAPSIILRNEKRMLQEAVDSLIDASARTATTRRRTNIQPLRSLSDMLRGKQGRFRQNLLGKRVDYSGRSVIVVGPELRLNQCGLPKEMALEMFKPFVLREMIVRGLAPNVKSAKNLLERRPPEVFDILEGITRDHPVLLNRQPTLHKLGFQAFYPILIEGNAIRIHPCICSGFGADFDGDQMGVHVPLSTKAQTEAADLMLPSRNLLRPADGSPISIPSSKEMALGVFYLTTIDGAFPVTASVFTGTEEVMLAYQTKKIGLRQKVRVRVNGKILETTPGRILFNEALPPQLRFFNDVASSTAIKTLFTEALRVCTNDEVVEMIDNVKDLGFSAGTVSGISFTITDLEILPEKNRIIEESNQRAAEIEQNYRMGLITATERKRLVQELWIETAEDLAERTWELYDTSNVVRLIVDAKLGRVSRDTVKQLSAMRGLFVDPTGKIVDLPTKSNFREGLSIFEYVTSARGGRKGLTDTAMKTADAGYLTRRLVDVAHDVLIRTMDCETTEGITIRREGRRSKAFGQRIFGRLVTRDVLDPKSKKVLVRAGEMLTEDRVAEIEAKNVNEVVVRSPITCKAKYGMCATCYGLDLAVKTVVQIGTPVGVIAAQSIGEPGTQLTINAKRSAFIIGLDVTQGLPRVEELFEARTPKTPSPLAEISGKAEVTETDAGYRVRIRSTNVKPPEEREYIIPLTNQLAVTDGDLVAAGTQIASGALDIKEVLAIRGLRAAQEYLLDEIQGVYESQGISIHDKHFEVIIRKMSDKVRVNSQGDTNLLPGEFVSRIRFEDANAQALAQGAEPVTAQQVILGITRASLYTESWLSAASFEQTTNVLTDAALEALEDKLIGLKENVIIGRLIPVTPDRVNIGIPAPALVSGADALPAQAK